MWKQLAELLVGLVSVAKDTRENKAAIAEMRREMHELAGLVEALSAEVRHIGERERLEREKQRLQLENTFLKLERRLSQVKLPKDRP